MGCGTSSSSPPTFTHTPLDRPATRGHQSTTPPLPRLVSIGPSSLSSSRRSSSPQPTVITMTSSWRRSTASSTLSSPTGSTPSRMKGGVISAGGSTMSSPWFATEPQTTVVEQETYVNCCTEIQRQRQMEMDVVDVTTTTPSQFGAAATHGSGGSVVIHHSSTANALSHDSNGGVGSGACVNTTTEHDTNAPVFFRLIQ
eukprot:PhF_6_TR21657/c2_g1_i1/m.30857